MVISWLQFMAVGIILASAHNVEENVQILLRTNNDARQQIRGTDCGLSIVESIPDNLTYPATAPRHMTTHDALIKLIHSAKHSIEIASFYWTLQRKDVTPHDKSANEKQRGQHIFGLGQILHFTHAEVYLAIQGQEVFDSLLSAGRDRHVKITIVKDNSTLEQSDDTDILAKQGRARVASLDMVRFFGGGVLHTKLCLVDRIHFYVGSANFDWRAYTQVKELGVLVTNCSVMAQDMGRLFDAYWLLAQPHARIPTHWPSHFSTSMNVQHPAHLAYNQLPAATYLSSSPREFCGAGRTFDLDAIIHAIRSAQKFIYIAVMDYFPTTLYAKQNKYWSAIDTELRRATFDRPVTVYLLASLWKHTYRTMVPFLSSLAAIDGTGLGRIAVKVFVVPAYSKIQQRIPFSRVNHNKYMVTETTAYIGTSNWSGDYFIDTAGIGLVITQPPTSWSSNEQSSRPNEQSLRFSEQSSRPNEQSLRFSEQSSRPNEQSLRFSEQSSHSNEQSLRFSKQSSRFSEQSPHSNEQSSRFSEQSSHSNEQSSRFSEQLSHSNEQSSYSKEKSTFRSNQASVREQIEAIFLRDWTSHYAKNLSLISLHTLPKFGGF